MGFFGNFSQKGGEGVFSNPKTFFLNLPSYLWFAKIILKCQSMFYNSGEVISDKFYHIILIQNLDDSEKNRRNQEVLGIFFFERGCHLFLKVNVRIVTKK